MSALSHQSYANTDTPYWASAVEPTKLISPATIRNKEDTKKVVITANANGTGGVFYANENGGNPLGLSFAQGATQPQNQLSLDVGNVNPVLTLTSSNVVSSLPIVIDSPLNAQNFQITPTPSGVAIQQGTLVGGGSEITMQNGPAGQVTIMGASTFDSFGMVVADKVGGETLYESQQVICTSGSGANVAKFGVSGTTAYVGTTNLVPNTATPGVVVNTNNGCQLQFRDATPNTYAMQANGSGTLQISAPSDPNAITISPTGVVTIPNIISGSFVPIGGIVMFSGNPLTLPSNWKVCDGVFPGTPDLTNKFIIGAGTFASGTSGGSATIGTSNLPAHNHGVTDPGHNHAITDLGHTHNVVLTGMFNNGDNGSAIVYAGQSLGGSAGNRASDPNAAQNNTTGISINLSTTGITTNNTGGGMAYYPPYYALAYIIRVA